MSSRPVSMLIVALITALTIGFAVIVIWTLQNRTPPPAGAAKPLSQAPLALPLQQTQPASHASIHQR